jgi:hypothetical protein
LLFATALCTLAGCASRAAAGGADRATTGAGASGITVFGTVDATLNSTRNR